jgi:hypothetical protein
MVSEQTQVFVGGLFLIFSDNKQLRDPYVKDLNY